MVEAGGAAQLSFVARAPVRITSNRDRVALRLDKADRPGLSLAAPLKLPVTLPLLLGGHELFGKEGRDSAVQTFRVQEATSATAGAVTVVELRFPPSRKWVPWVIAGAAVAVAGAVVLAVTLSPAPAGGADVILPAPMSLH